MYYSHTYEDEGYIYAIATILNPAAKLHAFTTAFWIEEGEYWVSKYQEIFTKIFEHYANKNPDIDVQTLSQRNTSCLDHISAHICKKHCTNIATEGEDSQGYAELETYLNEGKNL